MDDLILEPVTRCEVVQEKSKDKHFAEMRSRLNDGRGFPSAMKIRRTNTYVLLTRTNRRSRQITEKNFPYQSKFKDNWTPWRSKMYYKLLCRYYCPSLAVNCYATTRACPICARERFNLRMNSIHMKFFPATEPISSVDIYILG